MTYKLYEGDCLQIMPLLEDKSVDMILCDLPYGTTACKWDTVIPFEPLWNEYERLIKPDGAIVLTASQPFSSKLVMSNLKLFKYEWIWEKEQGTNFLNCNHQPLKTHENILIFGKMATSYSKKGNMKYSPQKIGGKPYKTVRSAGCESWRYDKEKGSNVTINHGERFPNSIIKFNRQTGLHPTQKPVKLFEYLIKTYTNEGDLVLDNCAGSGTTGVACKHLNRDCILIEKEQKYCEIIQNRLEQLTKFEEQTQLVIS